jgi:hypothetical protein
MIWYDFLLNQDKSVIFREVQQAVWHVAGIMEHLCDTDLYLLATYNGKIMLLIKKLKAAFKIMIIWHMML